MACISPVLIAAAHEDALHRQRVMRHVASRILARLHIPEGGRQIAVLLGKGHEQNNTDFLREWVERELGGTRLDSTTQLADRLAGKLVLRLMDHGYYPSYG